MISEQENSYHAIREAIIKEQLQRLLPWAEDIDLILCAYKFRKLLDGFNLNPKFEGGKC